METTKKSTNEILFRFASGIELLFTTIKTGVTTYSWTAKIFLMNLSENSNVNTVSSLKEMIKVVLAVHELKGFPPEEDMIDLSVVREPNKLSYEIHIDPTVMNIIHGMCNSHSNKLMKMFDIERVKQEIRNCPEDQTVILVPHWSINRPKYTNEEFENQSYDADWDELEEELGVTLVVTQYDDLVADPHGITIEG